MRGAATKSMSDIVEERQQSRYAPLPPRPFGLRPAGPLALLLAPHIRPGYCSSLAPCQRAWGPAAKCEFISARALRARASFFGLRLCCTRAVLQSTPMAKPIHGSKAFNHPYTCRSLSYFWEPWGRESSPGSEASLGAPGSLAPTMMQGKGEG